MDAEITWITSLGLQQVDDLLRSGRGRLRAGQYPQSV